MYWIAWNTTTAWYLNGHEYLTFKDNWNDSFFVNCTAKNMNQVYFVYDNAFEDGEQTDLEDEILINN